VPLKKRMGTEVRGLTIIEVLVVVAILGVILALSVPTVARVRNHGRANVTVANLRSHTVVATSYTTDYQDAFPVLTDAGASYSVVRCESAGIAVRVPYFGAFNLWNIALADQYYNGSFQNRSFQSGWDSASMWPGATLHWACSFLADPAYFDLTTRRAPPAQLRPTRASEVVFPSQKSLLTAYTPWVRFRRVFGGTLDGRASEFRDAELHADVRSGDGPYPQFGFHWPSFTPMTHTVHGVRGRDVR
jgi:prepilin-type N-terminal cleavage/methylation domain-containing protein